MIITLSFVVWASWVAAPMPEALAALRPGEQIIIETSPWLVFRPVAAPTAVGLILYPGGRVDYRAYAPVARAIAQAGYLVAIAPMPLSLAVLAPNRGADIQAAFPTIRRWAIGGHSLGGAMAARFTSQHPKRVHGLVLWAAYPSASASLATSRLAVVSISGTRDGLATPDKVRSARHLLPATTQWVVIEGGNHSQFGWYGMQSGDHQANLSHAEQQSQVIAATVALLRAIDR